MSPSPPRPAATAALLVLLCAAPAARADESSFRPYLVGARAAGMGGAFTALSDDGSGAWYNPGGLAFVQSSQLSIAGSVYGLVRGSFGDALGDGRDFRYSGIDTLPTATAVIRRLGSADGGADVFSDLGLCISGGSGSDLVPDNLDFSAVKVGRSRQLLAYVFLGTAYQF